jgi:hypothetical protein
MMSREFSLRQLGQAGNRLPNSNPRTMILMEMFMSVNHQPHKLVSGKKEVQLISSSDKVTITVAARKSGIIVNIMRPVNCHVKASEVS